MIVFLNFAPIRFLGGAERWHIDTATEIAKEKKTALVSVDESIADIYGRLVLGRPFTPRMTKKEESTLPNHTSLQIKHFIPFSSSWKDVRSLFSTATLIYCRFELLEICIIWYFSGLKALKKTVAGIHSPLIYADPVSMFDRLHTWVYESAISRWILQQMKCVHTVSNTDKKFLTETFKLQNVKFIPNYVEMREIKPHYSEHTDTRVLFVGELSKRKGVDVLCDVITDLPENISLHIAGLGPMIKEVERTAEKKKNVHMLGYIDRSAIQKIYQSSDVFFLPSRAEGMSLAMLEAMAHGLFIVDSEFVSFDGPDWIERHPKQHNAKSYIQIFKEMKPSYERKVKIHNFARKNYSYKVVMEKLRKEIFC